MKRSTAGPAQESNASSSAVELGKAHYTYVPPSSEKSNQDGLERLRGKLVRYWTQDTKGGICEYAYLVGWDTYGVLFQPESDGAPMPDAYEFETWGNIYGIAYFASDAEDDD